MCAQTTISQTNRSNVPPTLSRLLPRGHVMSHVGDDSVIMSQWLSVTTLSYGRTDGRPYKNVNRAVRLSSSYLANHQSKAPSRVETGSGVTGLLFGSGRVVSRVTARGATFGLTHFYPRDVVLARYWLWTGVCMSVCLSQTGVL